MRTRAAVIASWEAAQRRAIFHGVFTVNHASEAGRLLVDSGNDVIRALSFACAMKARSADPDWWRRVLEILEAILSEERFVEVAE